MFERRLQVLLVALSSVCLLLAVRAFSLQAVEQKSWTKAAIDAQRANERLDTTRGRILDVKGRELARDEPCIDACVNYQAVTTTPTMLWLRDQARVRARREHDDYDDLPLAQKKVILAADVDRVKSDIETMWHTLAVLSQQGDDALDETRRQIVRRVETQRRLAWYRKFKTAAASQPHGNRWYDWLVGVVQVELDNFSDLHVDDEQQAQVVLPHIDYALRNALARQIESCPGLVLREGVRRVYPYNSVACQAVGRIGKVTPEDLVDDPRGADALGKYAPTDDIGREGLERMLEPQLRGTHGARVTVTDDAPPQDTPPVPGQDVTVTLDIELQKKIEQAFTHVDFVRSNDLPKDHLDMPGAAVVIDVATGEVRAMASWPTYDVNRFDELFPTLVKDQINRPLTNRAIMMAVEPGSTVKPIIGMAGITEGVLRPMETIHCDGYLYIGNRKMPFGKCWVMQMFHHTHHEGDAPHPTNDLTFPEALQRSCNVFHETVAGRLGIGRISEWFGKFGLGRPTGVGLLPEASGLLPDSWVGPASERPSVTALAGIGESQVAATPMQMANVAATIARNGVWVRPTLRPGTPPQGVDLGVAPAAIAEAREGMFDVVNTDAGTGRTVQLQELMVSAKTGSAQTGPLRLPERDAQNNRVRDAHGRVIYDTVTLGTHDVPNPTVPWYRGIGADEKTRPAYGWMIGYAPSDHPKVAFGVLVEFGGGGGSAAGSVVKEILKACEEEGYLPKVAKADEP